MKFNWKKPLLVAADVAIAIYLLLAVTAFNEPDDRNEVCTQVKINISDDIVEGFLDTDEVKKILQRNNIYPLGKPMSAVNVREIEDALTGSPFVDRAQCYKTQSGHVCVTLAQRMPVIRVKADNGDDYYIDSRGGIMPNTRYTTDLIIATGNISRKYAGKVLTPIGNCIVNDRFWHNQIEQINVLADGTVEMVPRVGEHIVYLGRPVNIREKLARLEKFYKYGLNKVGWNKYSYISVEFGNQIICKRRTASGKHG